MIVLKEFQILKKICSPIAFNPILTSVRFAKRKIRQSKQYYEYTDMALWRKERGLTTNPNKFGPLTNLPDYSYLDGRPVPLGMNLKSRLERQKEYAETIVRLSSDLDFAKERHQEKLREQSEIKNAVIKNKLKRKGIAAIETIK